MDVKLSHMLLLLVVLAHAFTLIAADKSPNDDTSNSQTVLQPADAAASSHNETGFFTSVRHFFFGDSKTPETGVVESRTFGRIKKLQAALLPIMFKLGALSTMIGVLVFLAAKSVFIGMTLLVLNLVGIAVKLVLWKTGQHHEHYDHHDHQGSWQPQWQGPPQPKEVHVHIHNAAAPVAEKHYEPYGSYSTNSQSYAPEVHHYAPAHRRDALVTDSLSHNASPYLNANALGNVNANSLSNYHLSAFKRR